jgi:sodium transport system ATP-binding protein
MIAVEGLCKQFRGRDTPAVDDIWFRVEPGEIFGLLGPNGAGKTTTLRMLCTVLAPTAGFASVAGYDVTTQPQLVRQHIGFVSANTGVYDRMNPREMVGYYGKLYGLDSHTLRSRLDELVDTLQMAEFADVPCGKLSTGQKQKVSIARALIHDPPVLIFDEPTNGLDVLVQRNVLRSVRDLKARGKTILFSTHIFGEVEKLCDRVGIMAGGRIAASGTLAELRKEFDQPDLEEIFFTLIERAATPT